MSIFPKITALLYDMDGLLLNTEEHYTISYQQIAEQYGKTFDFSLKARMMGRSALDSIRIFVEALQLPLSPEEYLDQRNRHLQSLFPEAKPMPGAVDLSQKMHKNGVVQAVATSSTRETFAVKTKKHQSWFSLFDTIVTSNDPEVLHAKPAPDIFLIAAQRLQKEPHECLVFEDSPMGLQAALNAGMFAVVVPDPRMDRSNYQEAHLCLNSLQEFQPELWHLPSVS